MSSVMPVTMSPDEIIFTFKEAWERIFDSYSQTEPQMTMSLLLKNFYFGLVLCHRYALDAIVGGDFLHCHGDQAFNAIKCWLLVQLINLIHLLKAFMLD